MAKGRMLSKRENKRDFRRKASHVKPVNTKISMMRGGPRL